MPDDPFAPLPGADQKTNSSALAWRAIMPVPADAPEHPKKHPKHGLPARVDRYLDETGLLNFIVMRFDGSAGKTFAPLTFCASATGELSWRWQAPPAPRPLYRCDHLAQRLDAPVLVCEGEKSAEAAGRLASGLVTICSPNGSNAAAKANWGMLKGRIVYIWPDADEPGKKYALAVKKLALAAGAARVIVLMPPPGVREGWDAADAEAEGWDAAAVAALIAAAESSAHLASARDENREVETEKRRRTPEALIAHAQHIRFWVSTDGTAYAEIQERHRSGNVRISSECFKQYLTMAALGETGQLPSASAIDQAARYYAAKAAAAGERCKAWTRVGATGGKVYIDLCNARGRVVEISPGGVEIIARDGLPFIASEMTQELCEPALDLDRERPIDELRRFLNVEGDDDFYLIVGWLVVALCGRGPYPILLVKAEHGSGKTWLGLILSSLIDPCKPSVFTLPEKVRDLVAIAQNRHGLFLDNVSFLDAAQSDTLCIMAYGGGVVYRRLHTDSGVNVFDDARPIVLNGIEDIARRHDLASRGLFIRLKALADADRRPDDELERDWEEARPRILGALCFAVSSLLRNADKCKASGSGRMAQFEKFAAAAEPGLGFPPGTIADAYARNRICAEDVAFENDLVAVAVRDMMDADGLDHWTGTPTRLLEKLDAQVSEKIRVSREWPRNAVSLGRHYDRCKKILRSKGIDWRSTKSGARTYTITRIKKD